LDSSFDGDGKIITSMSKGVDHILSVAMQEDQKIVAAGHSEGVRQKGFTPRNFAIARYNANGSLDTSFDGDGKVTTLIGTSSFASEVAIQADQKIVVAGHASDPTQRFAVARYNANGSLDNSFSGDGKATTAFIVGESSAYGLAIQDDGKIIVSGGLVGGGYNLLARYNPDGSLDSSFDGDGKLEHALSGTIGGGEVVIQEDGKILVSGSNYVTRYNTDGSLDTSFASSGVFTHSSTVRSITLQPDQKILLGGGSIGTFAASRLNPDGGLDATFGGAGTVQIWIAEYAFARAIRLQADGRILLGGGVGDVGGTNLDYISARFNSDGTLDTTWGGGSSASTSSATLASTDTTFAPPPPAASSSITALDAASVQQLLAEPEAQNTWTRKSRFKLLAL
jgi:uncharacterized delta-60 repeat protein